VIRRGVVRDIFHCLHRSLAYFNIICSVSYPRSDIFQNLSLYFDLPV
jgi:hypothetical protein